MTADDLSSGRLIKLATFVDYDHADYDEPVLVEIDDMYLQFNRAKAFNIDTEEKQDQVTVTRKTRQGSDALSGLSAGDVYAEFFFGQSRQTLIVEACSEITGRRGADVMVISVALDKSLCEEFLREQQAASSAMDTVNEHLANSQATTQPGDVIGLDVAVSTPTHEPTKLPTKAERTPSPSQRQSLPPTSSPSPPRSVSGTAHAQLPSKDTITPAPTLWTPNSFEQVSNFWSLLGSWRDQNNSSSINQVKGTSTTGTSGFSLTPKIVSDRAPVEVDVIEASKVPPKPNVPSITSVFSSEEAKPKGPHRNQHHSGVQSIFSTRGSS